MGDPSAALSPLLRERLYRVLSPDVIRTVRFRRAAAATLVLLAAASALRPDAAGTYRDVAVATADLRPGTALNTEQVVLRKYPSTALPDGAITDLGTVSGATLAGPVRRGEVLTDARVLGPRSAGLNAGPDARVVPLRLTDPSLLDVIRTGDVVDVLGAADDDGPGHAGSRPQMLAVGAIVVLVAADTAGPGSGGDRVVLVAMPRAAAIAVAGASLAHSLTVTIH